MALLQSEGVNVRQFGAVGDGVTDDSGAFTSANAASQESTYVPFSAYELNGVDYTGDKFHSFGIPTFVSGTITVLNLNP